MKYFTIKELSSSNTAKVLNIDNTPNSKCKSNLKMLIESILDPIREAYGGPIRVSSGYRCKELNTIIKGSATSQHMTGSAADLIPKDLDTKKLFDITKMLIEEGVIEVGQLIWEYGEDEPRWVHVSLPNGKKHNEILYIR